MNKKFAEWYRIAKLEPTSDQLKSRWDGLNNFIEVELETKDIFPLIKMFYGKSIQEDFLDRYVQCFLEQDSAFDCKNKVEISVLAGVTLVEIIEQCNHDILAILAMLSFSFYDETPLVQSILDEIKRNFYSKSISIREDIIITDSISLKRQKYNELLKLLKESQGSWTQNIQQVLIEVISENDKNLNNLFEQGKNNKQVISIYSEDSQILWWMTGEWSNDLDKPFKDIKQSDASILIGKELADKITTLPGPYSAKAVIHKMLGFCGKKNVPKNINLKDIIDSLDITWKENFVKEYDIDGIDDITPIAFAISKSITVDKGIDWNPQFEKVTMRSSHDITKTVEQLAFQMYLECLTIKCYMNLNK